MGLMTALVAAGVGMAAVGTVSQMNAAKDAKAAQQQQIEAEQRAEALRKQQMEIQARRQNMEIVRNQQRARSMALATATAQGAGLGSGLQGGYGQIGGQTGLNLLGVSQGLQFGNTMFGINQDISGARMRLADAQSNAAFGAGLSSLGGTMISSAGQISSLGKNIFSGSTFGSSGYGASSMRYGA